MSHVNGGAVNVSGIVQREIRIPRLKGGAIIRDAIAKGKGRV